MKMENFCPDALNFLRKYIRNFLRRNTPALLFWLFFHTCGRLFMCREEGRRGERKEREREKKGGKGGGEGSQADPKNLQNNQTMMGRVVEAKQHAKERGKRITTQLLLSPSYAEKYSHVLLRAHRPLHVAKLAPPFCTHVRHRLG